MSKMTERVDSLAFFDQLAATTQPNVEHELPHFKLNSKKNGPDTVKPVKKEQDIINQSDFNKKWMDFTRAYRVEKEALCEHLKDQLIALDKLEQQFEQENMDLYTRIANSYNDISQDIQQHKEELRVEKKQYDNELLLLKEIQKFQDEKIKLNVGGQLFETSITTLRKDPNSMLAAMFGENKKIKPDADNSYFIDRDGTYFRLVLNYLRDLRIPSGISEDPKIMDELMQEAQFYKLNDLLKIKWNNLPVITQEVLYELCPPSNDPVVFQFEKKDMSNLDFSGYCIDPTSSFDGCNLENCQFVNAKFIFDPTSRVNFSNTYLIGTTFPKDDLQLRLDGAILNDELQRLVSNAFKLSTKPGTKY